MKKKKKKKKEWSIKRKRQYAISQKSRLTSSVESPALLLVHLISGG
jgi:hypothetical protein